MTPDHYHLLGGKIEKTKSTLYYSKNKLPSLVCFIETTQVISNRSHYIYIYIYIYIYKVYYLKIYLPSCL